MIEMGRIVAPFGVRGWLKVHAITGDPAALLDYPRWWLARDGGDDGDWRETGIAEARAHGKALIARPEGCDDRTQADAYRGMRVALPRRELPRTGDGEYYWSDLIGLRVENREGEQFGEVATMIATGANDVLVVRGDRERLIPFIAQVVTKVDLADGCLTVDWEADY